MDSTAIKTRAKELGLDACGITSADPARHAAFYHQWTSDGKAGEMQWMARDPERRTDPGKVLPGARSIIVVGLICTVELTRATAHIGAFDGI